jgi:uncharacterized protein
MAFSAMKQTDINLLQQIRVSDQSLFEWLGVLRDEILSIEHQFDPGHRIDHVDRVLNSAIALSQAEKADLCIVVPAVVLHDCLPISKSSPQRKKASSLCAKQAAILLNQHGYDKHLIDPIGHAIAAHSFSANITAESLEARVVQDADRLDSLGAIGIARTMMVGAQHNNMLYHPSIPFPNENRAPDEKHYIIDHFYQKLLKLETSFQTNAAKAQARKRTAFMHDFLRQLGDEVGCCP